MFSLLQQTGLSWNIGFDVGSRHPHHLLRISMQPHAEMDILGNGMVSRWFCFSEHVGLTTTCTCGSQTTSTALGCTYLTLSPHFASPAFRHWRAGFYAGFGLSSIIFVVHGLLLYGWELQRSRMSLVYMGWMATANLVGAAIYAARVRRTHSLSPPLLGCDMMIPLLTCGIDT